MYMSENSIIVCVAEQLHAGDPTILLIRHVRDEQQHPTKVKKPHRDVGTTLSRVDVGLSGVAGMPPIRQCIGTPGSEIRLRWLR
jgi:hypothetical protein